MDPIVYPDSNETPAEQPAETAEVTPAEPELPEHIKEAQAAAERLQAGQFQPYVNPEVVQEPEVTYTARDKDACLKKIAGILAEYNGMESNIPRHHEYWQLVNTYRGM